ATASEQVVEVRVAEQVDWYDAEADEVLVLTDGICVKQQKPTRSRSGAPQERMLPTVRVNTEVWLVERPGGGFAYLTAGIDAGGAETISEAQPVQGNIVAHYRGHGRARLGVWISDGRRPHRDD